MAHWETLPDKQFGTYVEYLAKLYFIRRGDDVYLPEIDNKGIDFIVRRTDGTFLEIQARGRRRPPHPREFHYFYIEKEIFPINERRWLFLALYSDKNRNHGDYFLIPSTAWLQANGLFKDKRYDKPGQESAPEWGLYLKDRHLHHLEPYRVPLSL